MQVLKQMKAFIGWYTTDAQTFHPIERAARVHGEFVKTHPFTDGNGRTSRLLMKLILMQSGFPATVIEVEQRLAYCLSSKCPFELDQNKGLLKMIKCHLSRIMDEKKLKVADVARDTGINRGTITRLYQETAVRVEFEVLEKLCLYLECEIGELLEIIAD